MRASSESAPVTASLRPESVPFTPLPRRHPEPAAKRSGEGPAPLQPSVSHTVNRSFRNISVDSWLPPFRALPMSAMTRDDGDSHPGFCLSDSGRFRAIPAILRFAPLVKISG
jgi:hypothetical protein